MDQERIEKREADYLSAATELDVMEHEFAEEVIRQAAINTDSYRSRDRATAELQPFFNNLRAKVHVAKLRLENAWREQGE